MPRRENFGKETSHHITKKMFNTYTWYLFSSQGWLLLEHYGYSFLCGVHFTHPPFIIYHFLNWSSCSKNFTVLYALCLFIIITVLSWISSVSNDLPSLFHLFKFLSSFNIQIEPWLFFFPRINQLFIKLIIMTDIVNYINGFRDNMN